MPTQVRLDQQLGSTFLGTGEYQISVVNRDPSLAEASYSLVASVDETPTRLRSATPTFGLASKGQPAFFTFEQAERGSGLQLLLSSFAGDPNLCVTRNVSALLERVPRYPLSWEDAPFVPGYHPPPPPLGGDYDLEAATRRFTSHLADACSWHSSLVGTDAITIPETDARGGPGEYFVAVFTLDTQEAHFQLTARPVDDTPVVLLAGQPQQAELEAYAWGYYTLAVPPNARRVLLSLTPREGDPDLYVRADGVRPTREPGSGYQAASTLDGADVLELLPG